MTILRNEKGHIMAGSKAINPGGRPKGLERRIREIVGEDVDELAKMLVGVALSRGVHAGYHIRDRLKATELLLDRGWGKARTTVELVDDRAPTPTLNIDQMTDEELAAYERKLELTVIDIDAVPPGTLARVLGGGK